MNYCQQQKTLGLIRDSFFPQWKEFDDWYETIRNTIKQIESTKQDSKLEAHITDFRQYIKNAIHFGARDNKLNSEQIKDMMDEIYKDYLVNSVIDK
jgi:hypothetical protein